MTVENDAHDLFYLNFIVFLLFITKKNREERRNLNRRGWHGEIEDPFLLFGSHRIIPKFASRRESVDSSSEERDDSKDRSESGGRSDCVMLYF